MQSIGRSAIPGASPTQACATASCFAWS